MIFEPIKSSGGRLGCPRVTGTLNVDLRRSAFHLSPAIVACGMLMIRVIVIESVSGGFGLPAGT